MAKVAINGLGRIGRAAFKIILDTPELELVGVNDIAPAEDLAYLLMYDTVYGRYDRPVTVEEERLTVADASYPVFSEKDPARLPWGELAVDLVFECTGVFRKQEDLEKHLRAGARHVVLSAPSKSGEVATIVHGVNAAGGDAHVISCASCTTNCITPVAEIMDRRLGVEKATLTRPPPTWCRPPRGPPGPRRKRFRSMRDASTGWPCARPSRSAPSPTSSS